MFHCKNIPGRSNKPPCCKPPLLFKHTQDRLVLKARTLLHPQHPGVMIMTLTDCTAMGRNTVGGSYTLQNSLIPGRISCPEY
jgi:hypothetical protein